MHHNLKILEKKLWDAADELRANSSLSSHQYSTPVLGLIFLYYADTKYSKFMETHPNADSIEVIGNGVLYLPENARFANILALPEGANIGLNINDAMASIELENDDLKGVLPKTYQIIENSVLSTLLKRLSEIPRDLEGDAFGKIYEYFLNNFAMKEGQGGGEFFTPPSLVRLIVEVIEPWEGRIYDPACGSGGMFVQSAEFVRAHHKSNDSDLVDEITVYGQEKNAETVRLAKMNMAVHGLSGQIQQGNSYYDVPFLDQKYDFVMANPPFNVNGVDKERLKNDDRFPFGLPNVDNGNYAWIQLFYINLLDDKGRAGFVMANSASDARGSEMEIRRQLIQDRAVDVMVAIGPNMFYTVTLPCTLWFFDKAKKHTERIDKVLFIDARNIFTQIDKAHREFSPQQIEFIANIVNLYRGEAPEFVHRSTELFEEYKLQQDKYLDIPGLCKVVTLDEIEKQAWSLNSGRYVGVATGEAVSDEDFKEQLEVLNGELEALNSEAGGLEDVIAKNVAEMLKK